MDVNGNQLKMILRFLGIRDLRVSTVTPEASITIQFERYETHQTLTVTLGELIQAVEAPESSPSQAPDGYTDIRDIPLPPPK